MKPFFRPSTKLGGKPVPMKPRAMNAGVLMFQPTAADKLKIAMGYGIQVHVQQLFQHNPGKIEVRSRWEVVPHTAMKDTPRIAPLTPPGGGQGTKD